MVHFPNIPRGRDFWSWPPVIAALAIVALALATSASRIALRALALGEERRALGQRIRALEAERERLEVSLQALESTELIERLAKEKLNLKQPGEKVVVLVPELNASTATPLAAGTGALRFLGQWLGALLEFLRR